MDDRWIAVLEWSMDRHNASGFRRFFSVIRGSERLVYRTCLRDKDADVRIAGGGEGHRARPSVDMHYGFSDAKDKVGVMLDPKLTPDNKAHPVLSNCGVATIR